MKKSRMYFLIGIVVTFILALVLIVGTDTNWGKTEITSLNLASADGDEIEAIMYRPKSATADNPAPVVLLTHGGGDMYEQTTSYAIELSRRGYVCVCWDYSGCANSDIPTGKSEATAMGANTVLNTVETFNFVDLSKICCWGHSMGGQYTMAFSCEQQDKIFLQVNLGMNYFGPTDTQQRDFNFIDILGIADESTLARTDDNTASIFQGEQFKRIFFNDYQTPVDQLPAVEIGKNYYVVGTNGKTYLRSAYQPNSCHAYYLVNNDAVQSVVYAITSTVGLGLDAGATSYETRNKVKTVWQWHDVGYFLQILVTAATMVFVASGLLETGSFKSLKLERGKRIGHEPKTLYWWIFLAVDILIPVVLFRKGILSQRNFLGMNISKLWLYGGTNNSYIAWQWTVSLAFIVVFLVYHFVWGKKEGNKATDYGFRTDGNQALYIVKSFLFGLCSVGAGYLVFALISNYTKQGMHIATFMMNTLEENRTLSVVMYFLFQIPYFLTTSLAYKTVGLTEGDGSDLDIAWSAVKGTLVAVGGLLLLWIFFMICVSGFHTLTKSGYFRNDRMYISTIAILPLFIGMSIANVLNIFVAKKTNSIWPGLFTALLWGAWMIVCCGGMSRYVY